MGKKQAGDNSQMIKGTLAGLVVAGLGYYILNLQSRPADPPGPIAGVAASSPAEARGPAVNTPVAPPNVTVTLPPANVPVQPAVVNPAGVTGPGTGLASENGAMSGLNTPPVDGVAVTSLTSQENPAAGGTASPTPMAGTPGGVPAASSPDIPLTELKLADLIERVEPAVVRINTRSASGYSIGSGYVVAADGTVVTNYHVIEGAKDATVEFADGTKSEVLGFKHYDPEFDIAIIQIAVPEKGLNVISLADDLPRKGESVVAFGAPHGLSFSATEGIISAIRNQEEMQGQMSLELKGTWLQTSTPISPGNSGGPLVDLFGRVVAMNTMQLAVGQNLNFAISAGDVKDMVTAARDKPLEKLSPDKLQEVDRSVKRRMARDISGTERGNQLLAKVDEIFLLVLYKVSNFDPTGAMTNSVNSHAELAIEKAGINLSFGEPSGDAAVMIVTVDMKPIRSAAVGTQQLVVDAFLICEDPEQTATSKLVKIWSVGETEIGTVALQAIARGQLPRTISAELTKFFNKFRLARGKAVRES